MTPCTKVYEAFLTRITADEWMVEEELSIAERDWQALLEIAIFRFKYPRVSLNLIEHEPVYDEYGHLLPPKIDAFEADLNQDEIQLLAAYMKHEWLKRCIASWDNIKTLYTDRDFSMANHLDKLIKLESAVHDEIRNMQGIYDRSRGKEPSTLFQKMAGKKNVFRRDRKYKQ